MEKKVNEGEEGVEREVNEEQEDAVKEVNKRRLLIFSSTIEFVTYFPS